MPLDPHIKRFLDMIALGGAGAPSVAQRRQGQQLLARLAGDQSASVPVRSVSLGLPGGIREARLYVPAEAGKTGPGLIFFHGGGLVAGDLDTHAAICGRLAEASGCRVVAVSYRLAPEHPFPAAIEDAVAAVIAIAGMARRLGVDAKRLGVGGEPDGAGLAARACQELRTAGPAIAAQLLLCPVLDLRCGSPSQAEFAAGYLLDAPTIRHDIESCGVADLVETPRVSPLLEPDLAGLPPAQIHVAEFDMFRDDGPAYAARLGQAGVAASCTRHDGMIHFFYGLGRLAPKAQPILAEIGARFGALLRGAARPDTASTPLHRRAS